jgi:pyruvate/2-oxoglutarate/acetoin dehydrogenase E1 component
MRPIVEIMFGDFLLLAADQIVNSATKFQLMFDNKVSVPLVIRVPMGGRRGYGPTHSQTLEAFFINTPNLEIVAPSHLHDVGLMLEKAVLESNGVKLFVENKLLYSQDLIDISSEHPIFCFKSLECYSGDPFPTIQASIRDEDAADVILITYGGMSPFALEAAEKSFLEEEISTTCLLVSRVKPLPISAIKQACASSKKILIVEEGVKYGGWGSELSVQLHEANKTGLPIKIQRVGMREYVIPSAKALEDQILPQTYDIYQSIKELFDER